jgi:hypothetical protein
LRSAAASLSLAGLAFGIASGSPTVAHAYRTYADDPEVLVSARQRPDRLTWDLSTATDDAAAGPVEAAAHQAFATWAAPDCTSLDSEFLGRTIAPAAAGDGRNTIEIVRSGWLERGFPEGRGATTDVQIRTADGVPRQAEITESDVYLNFESFEFGVAGATASDLDLQGVLTHEIGHVLGLLHPCEEEPTELEVGCDVSPDSVQSVMYPTYLGSSQRELDVDDINAVCFLYPSTGCPPTCGLGRECRETACAVCATPDCTVPPAPCVEGSCSIGACARHVDEAGMCVAAGNAGTPCARSSDCASSLCLTRVGTSPIEGYCTTACAEDADCSGTQRCGEEHACEPVPTSSCSVASPGTRKPAGFLPVLAVLLVRRRRRGPRRTTSSHGGAE